MNTDIVDLREFYHSPLGRSAEQAITMALSTLWPPLPEERLVGLGYAVPFLDRFRRDTERTFAFMPAGQGAVNWPAGELSSTALVFDEELPLPDSSIDRVLMVHALEFAENPRESLKELWRRAAAWSSWCRTAAASGRAWNTRLSVPAGPIRAGS